MIADTVKKYLDGKVKELEAAKFEILLKPNSSLTGAARILFLGSIFFICGVIGIGFFRWRDNDFTFCRIRNYFSIFSF